MSELLGELRSSLAFQPLPGQVGVHRTSKHKYRVFPSRQQLKYCFLEEKVLPLLQYQLSLRVKKVFMLFRFLFDVR